MKQAHPAKDNLITEFPWNPPHEPNWGFKGAVVLWMFRTCLKIHLPFTPTLTLPLQGGGSLKFKVKGREMNDLRSSNTPSRGVKVQS